MSKINKMRNWLVFLKTNKNHHQIFLLILKVLIMTKMIIDNFNILTCNDRCLNYSDLFVFLDMEIFITDIDIHKF